MNSKIIFISIFIFYTLQSFAIDLKDYKGRPIDFERFSSYNRGSIKDGRLNKNTTIKVNDYTYTFGARYKAGYSHSLNFSRTKLKFYPDGTVKEGVLAKNKVIKIGRKKVILKGRFKIRNQHRVSVYDGGKIKFHPNGVIYRAQLARNVTLKIGKNKISFKANYLEYNKRYRIRGSRDELKVRSIRLYNAIGFHDNWDIAFGTLLRNTRITVGTKKLTFKKKHGIYFYKDGIIKGGVLSRPQTFIINGIKIKATGATKDDYDRIFFHRNGALRQCSYSNSFAFKMNSTEFPFRKKYTIYFWDNGIVRRGTLAQKTTFLHKGKTYILENKVYFYKNGKLAGATLGKNITYTISTQQAVFNSVLFYDDGTFKGGKLVNDIIINGKKYKKSGTLLLNKNGTIKEWKYYYSIPLGKEFH